MRQAPQKQPNKKKQKEKKKRGNAGGNFSNSWASVRRTPSAARFCFSKAGRTAAPEGRVCLIPRKIGELGSPAGAVSDRARPTVGQSRRPAEGAPAETTRTWVTPRWVGGSVDERSQQVACLHCVGFFYITWARAARRGAHIGDESGTRVESDPCSIPLLASGT